MNSKEQYKALMEHTDSNELESVRAELKDLKIVHVALCDRIEAIAKEVEPKEPPELIGVANLLRGALISSRWAPMIQPPSMSEIRANIIEELAIDSEYGAGTNPMTAWLYERAAEERNK